MYVVNWLRILLCLGFCLGVLSLPSMGEEPPTTAPDPPAQQEGTKEEQPVKVEQLEPIEVLSYAEKAATSTVVTKEDISMGPYMNLPGYLEEQSGIDLRRRSELGVKANQMNLRGFDESRYQVYLNGRSWKGAGVKGGFYVDWATITQEDLERLEIIRGPLSAEYPNTLGGTIVINTIKGSKDPKIYLDTYWGSWETQNYRLLHTGSHGPLQWAVGGSFANSDQYLRNNFAHDRGNFSGNLTYTLPWGTSLTGSTRYFTQNTGMIVYNRPGSPYYQSNEPTSDGDSLYGPPVGFKGNGINGLTWGNGSYVHSQRTEWDFEAKQPFWKGEAEFHYFYTQAVRDDHFYSMKNPNLQILERGSWDEDTWGWNFKVRQTFQDVRLGMGVQGNYFGYGQVTVNNYNPEYVNIASTLSTPGVKNAQKLHGGFLDASIPFLKYFELYLGLRNDYYDAAAQPKYNVTGLRTDAWSPKSTLTIRPTGTTDIYVSANYSNRFPTSPEVYWFSYGYRPPGRSDSLSPEFGMQYEAGVTQKLPYNSLLRVRTYYYDINNYIRLVQGYVSGAGVTGFAVYNINLAIFRGVEVEGQVGLPYNLKAFANYTWQQTSSSPDPLNGNVNKLTELPENKANIGLKYQGANGAEAKLYVRLVSHRAIPAVTVVNNKVSTLILRPINGFTTVNLEGRYPVVQYNGIKGFLYFGVENLFSERYQEDAGFPMPSATIYGGMQLRY
jgi:iron complex outermembrane receptor protein